MSLIVRNGLISAVTVGWPMSSLIWAANIGWHLGISTISPCPSFCGPIPPGHTDFAFDGGARQSSAFASIDNIEGDGEGIVDYVGSWRQDLYLGPGGGERDKIGFWRRTQHPEFPVLQPNRDCGRSGTVSLLADKPGGDDHRPLPSPLNHA